MLPLAYFGIESNAFTTAVDLLIVVAAVIYLALIYWTYADARRRIADPMLIGCATPRRCSPSWARSCTSSCAHRSTWRMCRSANWRSRPPKRGSTGSSARSARTTTIR